MFLNFYFTDFVSFLLFNIIFKQKYDVARNAYNKKIRYNILENRKQITQ